MQNVDKIPDATMQTLQCIRQVKKYGEVVTFFRVRNPMATAQATKHSKSIDNNVAMVTRTCRISPIISMNYSSEKSRKSTHKNDTCYDTIIMSYIENVDQPNPKDSAFSLVLCCTAILESCQDLLIGTL